MIFAITVVCPSDIRYDWGEPQGAANKNPLPIKFLLSTDSQSLQSNYLRHSLTCERKSFEMKLCYL